MIGLTVVVSLDWLPLISSSESKETTSVGRPDEVCEHKGRKTLTENIASFSILIVTKQIFNAEVTFMYLNS